MAKIHSSYDNEATQFADNNEATQFDNQFEDTTGNQTRTSTHEATAAAQPKKKSLGKRIAGGAAIGMALGAGMATLSSATPPENAEADNDNATPEWTDGQVPVAHGVSDDMSFTDAFDTARMEVGPGGVFEWNGYIYSTYTEEEWNHMSADEQQAFGAHFNWTEPAPDNAAATAANGSAHSSAPSSAPDNTHVTAHTATGAHTTATGTHTTSEGPDYLSGQDTPGGEEVHIGATAGPGTATAASTAGNDDAEIEILGVQHDNQTGYTYANLSIDNHDAVLVDINNDNTFDVMAVDANNNGQLEENEIIDVSGHGITAQSLGIDSQNAQLMAQNTGNDPAKAYTDPSEPVIVGHAGNEDDPSLCGTPETVVEDHPAWDATENNCMAQDDLIDTNSDSDYYAG